MRQIQVNLKNLVLSTMHSLKDSRCMTHVPVGAPAGRRQHTQLGFQGLGKEAVGYRVDRVVGSFMVTNSLSSHRALPLCHSYPNAESIFPIPFHLAWACALFNLG